MPKTIEVVESTLESWGVGPRVAKRLAGESERFFDEYYPSGLAVEDEADARSTVAAMLVAQSIYIETQSAYTETRGAT